MEINKIYNGFKLERIKEIKDIGATMYEFKHIKSNGNLVYLENDDTNKCFAAGFRTLPEDSTGVCHIIEHSVLSGSKKYPLKETFANLIKGSMATFLNAMTAYDWTCYPVASQNDIDFKNLMSVYLDSVFAPLSVTDPKAFLQEGWHLEMFNKDEMPRYQGVVYNEMKGAMSSVDSQLEEAILAGIYNGTGYGVNSGGDPKVIPSLTYEYYQNYYKNHYHPANGILYLYGKMDILEKLQLIDEQYLSKFDYQEGTVIDVPKKLVNKNIEEDYAIGDEEELEDNTYYGMGFALDTYDNARDLNGLNILNEALMSNNSSPLKKMLLDSKIFQDVNSWIDDDCILPSLFVSFQKSNQGLKNDIYDLFINSCKKIVKEGIDKGLLTSIINNAEFRNKEMDMGRMPKGLFFLFNILQCFNYHIPYETYLEYSNYFDYFRKELNNGYFEGLIEKYILNSDHNVLVAMNPSKTLAKELEDAMNKKMADLKMAMTDDDINEVIKQNEMLRAYQSHQDTKEELDMLPKIRISDVDSSINTIDSNEVVGNNIKYFEHNVNTNKIGYLKMYFDCRSLNIEDVQYAKLLSSFLGNFDTNEFNDFSLRNYIKTYLGEFTTGFAFINNKDIKPVPVFSVKTSALDLNINYMTKAINEILFHTKFDDEKVKTMLLQQKNGLRSEIIESGNSVAMDEAASVTSESGYCFSLIHGIKLYRFVSNLIDNFDGEKLYAKFNEIINKVFNKGNVLVSVSGDSETITKLKSVINETELKENKFDNVFKVTKAQNIDKALVIPSQVNYDAMSAKVIDNAKEISGIIKVAEHIISTDFLWNEVRVKGGAYGVRMSSTRNGEIITTSYRDPNVENTYNVYDRIHSYLENLDMDEEAFESYVIGALGSFDQPASINSMVNDADIKYMAGITDNDRRSTKEQMINCKLNDVKSLAKVYERFAKEGTKFAVGNETKINEFNKFNEVNKL